MPRCGHTSMTGYFGFEPYTLDHNRLIVWNKTQSRRVLVLRNPLDRLKSALLHSDAYEKYPEFTSDQWLSFHGDPYLHRVSHTSFDIIPFENLSDYIPVHRMTRHVNVANTTYDELKHMPQMEYEYEKYQYYKQNNKVITPEEWKELTP